MERFNGRLEECRKNVMEILEQVQLGGIFDEANFKEVYFAFAHRFQNAYTFALFISDSLITAENFKIHTSVIN